jgi:hypothetical protein
VQIDNENKEEASSRSHNKVRITVQTNRAATLYQQSMLQGILVASARNWFFPPAHRKAHTCAETCHNVACQLAMFQAIRQPSSTTRLDPRCQHRPWAACPLSMRPLPFYYTVRWGSRISDPLHKSAPVRHRSARTLRRSYHLCPQVQRRRRAACLALRTSGETSPSRHVSG